MGGGAVKGRGEHGTKLERGGGKKPRGDGGRGSKRKRHEQTSGKGVI